MADEMQQGLRDWPDDFPRDDVPSQQTQADWAQLPTCPEPYQGERWSWSGAFTPTSRIADSSTAEYDSARRAAFQSVRRFPEFQPTRELPECQATWKNSHAPPLQESAWASPAAGLDAQSLEMQSCRKRKELMPLTRTSFSEKLLNDETEMSSLASRVWTPGRLYATPAGKQASAVGAERLLSSFHFPSTELPGCCSSLQSVPHAVADSAQLSTPASPNRVRKQLDPAKPDISVRELQERRPEALEAFLHNSFQTFPTLFEYKKNCKHALSFIDGLSAGKATTSGVVNEVQTLFQCIFQLFANAQETSLENWRRVQESSRCDSGHAEHDDDDRELASAQAVASAYRIELEEMRRHMKKMRSFCDGLREKGKMVEELCSRAKNLRQELGARKAAVHYARRRAAAEHLEPMEATCRRLRELAERQKGMMYVYRAQTCRIEKLDGGDGLRGICVIFRGNFQLRICRATEGGDANDQDPLMWLRFEPRLPVLEHATDSDEASAAPKPTPVGTELGSRAVLEQLEIHLARLWLCAIEARPGAEQRAAIVVPRSQVARIVRRLNTYSLDADQLVRDLGAYHCGNTLGEAPKLISSPCRLGR